MLDVHAPHEGIYSFRDFLIHLLTITIGLLIALGLEGCVEWFQHRQLEREADANIRQELKDNQQELRGVRAAITAERGNLMTIIKFLQARTLNQPTDAHSLSLGYNLGTLQDASWHTASATGALSYMEYQHVKRYAVAYLVQDEYVTLQRETLDDYLDLMSYLIGVSDPRKMPPAEAQTALISVQRTLSHLSALDQFAGSLTTTYQQALAAR